MPVIRVVWLDKIGIRQFASGHSLGQLFERQASISWI
jgi:hypothetical protein